MKMEIILVSIALFLWGLFMLLFPYRFWKLFEGWKNKSGAEPTERYVTGVRVGGCVYMILALAVLVYYFFIM